MAETSRCAAPVRLFAVTLLMAISFSPLRGQPANPATDSSKLEGAYASSDEPDMPVSIYPKADKLVIESEDSIPMELTRVSDVEYAFPGPKATVKFSVDVSRRAQSLTFSTAPDSIYTRIGPSVHHVF